MSTSRIAALDIARGIAILGTLATNIWLFSHPAGFLGALGDPLANLPGWHAQVARLLMALPNGKFLGLLTLMFGIGLAIQAASAQRRGARWPGGYPVRAALLFVEGLAHFLLIAEFDVLMGYALTSLVVCFLVVGSPRVRIWVAGVCVTLHLMVIALMTWGLIQSSGEVVAAPASNPYRDGSWLDLVALRVDRAALFRAEPIFIGPMTVAMFLAGAWLFRAGVFDARGARLRRTLLVAGAVAAPLDLALALTQPGAVFVCRYVLAPVVSAGLLALIAHLWLGRTPGWAARRLGEVGRMALSCYVAQNLVASTLFYGWGLGLNALTGVRLPLTVAAYLGICAAMVLFAHLWQRRFSRGPVEWAWVRGYEALVGTRR